MINWLHITDISNHCNQGQDIFGLNDSFNERSLNESFLFSFNLKDKDHLKKYSKMSH